MIRTVERRAPNTLVNSGLALYIRIQQAFGRAYHEYRSNGREFRYAYDDKQSFIQHWKSIENGVVGTEGVPLELLTLSDSVDGILDIGAHQGLYTVVLGVLNPDIPLVAAEPVSENAAYVRKNAELNDIEVHVEETLVSDVEGQVTFYNDADAGSERHTTTPSQDVGAYRESTVESTTASTLATRIKAKNLFLKIDAEGEERAILEELHHSDIPNFRGIVELHPDKLSGGIESILRTLDNFGTNYEFVTESSPDHFVSRPTYYFER